ESLIIPPETTATQPSSLRTVCNLNATCRESIDLESKVFSLFSFPPPFLFFYRTSAGGGEIFDQCVADNDDAFTEKDVIRLARQILMGVAFLHCNNVVHLDLKPQNILLTSARPLGDIRIVDFGLSRHMDSISEVREILGTPEYVAPEILSYEPISTATDMWSIGVLTYVMLTGESPFLGDDKQETFLNISQVSVEYSHDTFQDISPLAVDFIKSLLVKNPR
ncbi:serine/threonine-protein kinase 17A-like, partial [Hippocampus comes]|uniref:serine/threonine-protein kinase 17A-like n=1 Tax=Hippocampus comes TaxID=109280 RepID=UPI00094EFB85